MRLGRFQHLLERGGHQEEDDQDEHDVDHARDIDNIPVLRGAFATAVHDSSAFFGAVFFGDAFLAADFAGAFLAESAYWTTKAVPVSSM